MSFHVFLAALNALTGQLENAWELLKTSQNFYANSGDELSVQVIELYLAYICLQSNRRHQAIARTERALSWFSQRNLDYFPHWWHPHVVAEVCALALEHNIYPNLVERMFIKHLRQAGMAPLTALLSADDIQIQNRANNLIAVLKTDYRFQLRAVAEPGISDLLESALKSGFLRANRFNALQQKLVTAQRRKTRNYTLLAVYTLYLQGFSRGEIGGRLGRSESLVKNYITAIYQIFDLPKKPGQGSRERRASLMELCRRSGFIK